MSSPKSKRYAIIIAISFFLLSIVGSCACGIVFIINPDVFEPTGKDLFNSYKRMLPKEAIFVKDEGNGWIQFRMPSGKHYRFVRKHSGNARKASTKMMVPIE